MQLWECEFITKIPDLSSSPNLEYLDLTRCKNLVEVHHSVGLLDKLSEFWVYECSKLRIFPKRFKLRSLCYFDFTYCSSLEDFPEIECEMVLLKYISLQGTSIKELPSSIENLKGLEVLSMHDCSTMKLPSSIVNLKGLKSFRVEGCIDQLGSVRLAKVDGYSQPIINIGKVEEEDGIQSISSIVSTGEYEIASTTPTNLSIFNDAGSSSSSISKSLKELYLKYCCLSESNFFTYVNYFPALEKLDLSGSDIVIFPPHQGVRFPKLQELRLNNCKELKEILSLPSSTIWKSLEQLYLEYYCLSESNFFTYVNYFPALEKLDLSGSDIVIFPPHQGVRFPKLQELCLNNCKELKEILSLPSSIRSVSIRRVCSIVKGSIVEVDDYSQPIINIGKVEEEDGIQSTSSIVSISEYEIASTTPTNLSISNDAGSSSSSIWKSLKELYLEYCCLLESNFFTYVNYFPTLEKLDLSGSDIVIFPPHQGVRFPKLEDLCLNNCKELKEIFLPLPSIIRSVIIRRVCTRGCTSLESFALPSEILTKKYGRDFSKNLDIDLYGCHKLIVIPSWEEGFQSLAYPPFDPLSDISIILPGMKIPSWFSYLIEAHDNNLCEIDINPPHHWNGMYEILVIYVVFGFRSVGIIERSLVKQSTIHVQFHDGSDWETLKFGFIDLHCMDVSDHVWMHKMIDYRKQVDVSRFRFECKSELVVFRSVGIHFQKMHGENVRDDIGDHIELGYPFSYSSSEEASSDEKGERCLDLMDEKRPDSSTMGITITELENEDMDFELKLGYPFSYPFSELENDDEDPNEDLELEKVDENSKEIFGKRHRDDEYDCNMEPNRCPQQKRPHIYSSTMGTITEVENDLNLDLELKLGFRA